MTTQITTHAANARGRLISQYKDANRLHTLMDGLFSDQIQAIEDAAFAIFGKWDIDAASQTLLDEIGDLVGQKRQGQADDLYRVFIKARIGANTSEGDREKLLQIWGLMIPGAKITIFETYPAALNIYTDIPLDAALVTTAFTLIQEVAAGGVRIGFTAVYDTVEAFGFAEGESNIGGFNGIIAQGTTTQDGGFFLPDSAATFITSGVTPGMAVRNGITGVRSVIVSVDSETQVTVADQIFMFAPIPYVIDENVGGKLSYIQGS